MLELNRPSSRYGVTPRLLGHRMIIRMNNDLPAPILNVRQLKARIVPPCLVDELALSITPKDRDQCRDHVDRQLKLALGSGQHGFALPQRFFGALALGILDPQRFVEPLELPDRVLLLVADAPERFRGPPLRRTQR